MTFAEIRILSCFALTVGGCAIAIRFGEEPERRTAILMAAAAVGTIVVQFLTHRFYEAAIVGQFTFGAGLLWLVARYRKPWLWFMTVMGGALFFLHSLLYPLNSEFGPIHTALSDLIASCAPLLVAGVALRNRSLRRRASPAAPPRAVAATGLR